jgi:hypothetical protein
MDENTTLDYLDQKIQEAETGEEAKKYAEAYKTMQEADTEEYLKVQELDVEERKSKRTFWAAVITAAGVVGAAIIKVAGDLKFQQESMKYEDEDAYVNYRKHRK